MRYRKGYIALSDDRDVPLLVTIRNARAITYEQICSLALLKGSNPADGLCIGVSRGSSGVS
jgi:hypothetical protein